MMNSSIFLSNVTLIDAAYLDPMGVPHGLSVSPVFILTGKVEGKEQVVLDFSAARKRLKILIDDRKEGFDHKLWVDANVHKIGRATSHEDFPHYQIDTPHISLRVPTNAVRLVNMGEHTALPYMLDHVALELGEWLTEQLSDLKIHVAVTFPNPTGEQDIMQSYGTHGLVTGARQPFSYTHGLPNSSSWGCQNILHGHTSFIDLITNDLEYESRVAELAELITKDLDESYMYDRATFYANAAQPTIGYRTERGDFDLMFVGKQKLIELPAAPTIENIVEWVVKRHASALQLCKVSTVAVSEGLWKGARIDLPNYQWLER